MKQELVLNPPQADVSESLTLFLTAYRFPVCYRGEGLIFTPPQAKNTLLSVRFQFFYTCIEIYVQLAKIKIMKFDSTKKTLGYRWS